MARIVVALGGNALLKRGEEMTAANQRANARIAAEALAPLCAEHEVVITHGNGPQVGLLALQEIAYPGEDAPLDVLGAETEGMIGYMIEQELGNLLPFEKPLATLLTMVEVDPDDPAFQDPTKFVGQVYDEAEAKAEAAAKGWIGQARRRHWRRVVPSPLPKRIFQLRPIQWLLEKGTVVIAAGGGGIPTMYEKGTRRLVGVECVIDKDRATALLAREIGATVFVCATDADAVYLDWGKPGAAGDPLGHARRDGRLRFPAGSMGPEGRGGAGLRPRHRRPRHHLRPRRRAAAVRAAIADAGSGRRALPLRLVPRQGPDLGLAAASSSRSACVDWPCSACRSSCSATPPPRDRTRWRWSSARSWRSPSPGRTATRSPTCATPRSPASPPGCRRSSSCSVGR